MAITFLNISTPVAQTTLEFLHGDLRTYVYSRHGTIIGLLHRIGRRLPAGGRLVYGLCSPQLSVPFDVACLDICLCGLH